MSEPEPDKRGGVEDLISAYPSHIPMGLPLPRTTKDDDRPDSQYVL